jgi:hypothetical protein
MKIAVFKDKSCIRPFRLEYLELEKSIWYKLNCFGFLTRRPTSLPSFNRKKSSYEGDMIFLRRLINSTSRQVLWKNKSNLLPKRSNRHPNIYLGNLTSLSSNSKLEDFMQDYFFFFLYRKIVIALLKCKLST